MKPAEQALADRALPPGSGASHLAPGTQGWTGAQLEALARHLREAGPGALARLGAQDLLDAWCRAIDVLRDPASPPRRALEPGLARATGLSRAGLEAALATVLGGLDRSHAARLITRAPADHPQRGLVVIVLASNVPALAVQALLPALALGRPALIKSATAEPYFAPALVHALGQADARLRDAMAAVTWPGGMRVLENAVFHHAERVLAYGARASIADLRARLGPKLCAFGPKLSLAVIGREIEPREIASGLARDIALFDQRGCLSIQAIYTAGDAQALARALAAALVARARAWPMGAIEPSAAAAVQRLRACAVMKGQVLPALPLASGTVMVEPDPTFSPSPGLRTVRIHPLPELAARPRLLRAWRGSLQGAALAGSAARALMPRLRELGIRRMAAPGALQDTGATWDRNGRDPLEALA